MKAEEAIQATMSSRGYGVIHCASPGRKGEVRLTEMFGKEVTQPFTIIQQTDFADFYEQVEFFRALGIEEYIASEFYPEGYYYRVVTD